MTTHHPDTAPGEDLAYEREVLDESIRHDYSTSDVGIVPLTRRRPMWHFMGLWTTFVAGFSYMFLGFELHDGGHDLAATVGITAFGYGLYIAYALPIFLRLRLGDAWEPGEWNLGRWYKVIGWTAVIWVAFISVLFIMPITPTGIPFKTGFTWLSVTIRLIVRSQFSTVARR